MAQMSSDSLEMFRPQPFIKWAGGKSQLVERLSALAPTSFKRYFEPFVGGGAFFFHLHPRKALISDANFELINSNRVIKNELRPLLRELESMSALSLTSSLFRRYRDLNPDSMNYVRRAARFIFLNKTCFNGLYRVNKLGKLTSPLENIRTCPHYMPKIT
jgi:DNA adenine methylase